MCGVDWHEMVGLRPKRLVPRYVIASLASRTSASEGRESPVPVRRDCTVQLEWDANVESTRRTYVRRSLPICPMAH